VTPLVGDTSDSLTADATAQPMLLTAGQVRSGFSHTAHSRFVARCRWRRIVGCIWRSAGTPWRRRTTASCCGRAAPTATTWWWTGGSTRCEHGRVGFGTGRDRERPSNEAQRPHSRVIRVALGTRLATRLKELGGRAPRGHAPHARGPGTPPVHTRSYRRHGTPLTVDESPAIPYQSFGHKVYGDGAMLASRGCSGGWSGGARACRRTSRRVRRRLGS
jgi:hypothetical protein